MEKGELARLRRDCADMMDIHNFYRCGKCDRLDPLGYCCVWCGFDNSRDEDEDAED